MAVTNQAGSRLTIRNPWGLPGRLSERTTPPRMRPTGRGKSDLQEGKLSLHSPNLESSPSDRGIRKSTFRRSMVSRCGQQTKKSDLPDRRPASNRDPLIGSARPSQPATRHRRRRPMAPASRRGNHTAQRAGIRRHRRDAAIPSFLLQRLAPPTSWRDRQTSRPDRP